MGKAISEKIFNAWCKRMEDFLMCYKKDRLLFQKYLEIKEKKFEDVHNCELNMNDDAEGGVTVKRGTMRSKTMKGCKFIFSPLITNLQLF